MSGLFFTVTPVLQTVFMCVFQEGMQLISEKPETEAVVKEKLTGLHKMWEVLESTTQTKAQRLFDANKAELFTQSCADLDKWLHGLESQIQSDDYGKDLTSVNILLKKQQASAWAGAPQAVSPLWSCWSQLAHHVLRHSLGV